MRFTPEHIISVTHDLMLVSKDELIRFLDYMCERKLPPAHIVAANDFSVKPLVKQFPWLLKVDSTSLEEKKRLLSYSLEGGVGAINGMSSPAQLAAMAEKNTFLMNEYKTFENEWLEKTKKALGLKPSYEVKTVRGAGFKPWSKEAFTYWWMFQRNKDE